MNLEISLQRHRNVLFGHIISQDENLRSSNRDRLVMVLAGEESTPRRTNFQIISATHPDLANNILYVRGGDRNRDHQAFCYQYASDEIAIIAQQTFELLLEQLNHTGD